MKTLLLLRHAKSSWTQPELGDHDRPLNKRGKQARPRVGVLLQDENLVPDLIICSSAKRTHHTALLVAEACSYKGKITKTRRLYLAEPLDYVDVLDQVADQDARVPVVGQNPGLESLIKAYIGEAIAMPTAALAHLKLSLKHWKDLDLNTKCELVNVWRPKELE